MVLFLAVQVFSVLALGPQVVLSTSGTITIQLSKVLQCEPVSVTFAGKLNPHPTWLTLVPFSSTPVSIPITNISSDLSSVAVTFVPFVAGTKFIASLDDANHNSVAEVSDIIQVLPSPTGNMSCLPKSDRTGNDFVVNNNTLSQCEDFTIQYNRTVISHAPIVRLFNPEGPSRFLNLMSDDTTTGTATYLLSFDRTKNVVLVFDDGSGHSASSAIMIVSGDVSSPVDCLATTSNAPTRISMPAVIGISVGGGLVVLVAFCMLLFILHERRRRRGADLNSNVFIGKSQPSRPVKKRLLFSPTPSRDDQVFLKGAPYNKEKYTSGTTMASWSQPIPNDQQAPSRTLGAYDANDAASMNSLDIEGMLHIAAVHSNRTSRQLQTAESVSLGSGLIPSEPPSTLPHLTSKPSRQHNRDPSDVTSGRPSMASAISLTSVVDPFANDAFKRHGQAGLTPSRQSSVRTLVQVPLPILPRHDFRTMRERSPEVNEVS